MPPETASASQGLLDVERELTCSICTDILYQPLTLLDCLHSFCGPCLKEWFSFQAASAAAQNRRSSPYTCPSCRESVRGTKADWRVTTLLEGYLKANPNRVKSDDEKEEMKAIYKPGDNVIPKLQPRRRDADDEDGRLIAHVRELSMADVDPHARTRSSAREPQATRTAANAPLIPGQDTSPRHIEHQSSLRSLLSASPVSILDAGDVQQEILQSIYAEGLLDDIDVDNLTTEQEEELTERIAEAYRRRQRRRDRSGNRDRRQHENPSPQPETSAEAAADRPAVRQHARTVSASDQAPRTRPRVPIARPHVFEQANQEAPSSQRRNTSDVQRSPPSAGQPRSTDATVAGPQLDVAVRDDESNTFRERRRRMSSNARSTTDPEHEGLRAQAHQARASSHNPPRRRATDQDGTAPTSAATANNSTTRLPEPTSLQPPVEIRSAPSFSAFAPEPVSRPEIVSPVPAVDCKRCGKQSIQWDLHYHCDLCRDGNYDICLGCYRDSQGCDHWFGFGYMAYDRWHRLAPPEGWPANYGQPHVLIPRRYDRADSVLKQGAFCEHCFSPCNECYYYCTSCLEGAWGFCAKCVQQGRHCTHSLLPLGDEVILRQQNPQTSKSASFVLPHLPNITFVGLPVHTDCDICRRGIPPQNSRFHCCACSEGDYDVCGQCYEMLVATNRIGYLDGPNGWRRCLQGHRMTVVAYQDIPRRGRQRVTIRDPVGGWQLQETQERSNVPPPPDMDLGSRCLAIYNRFPPANVTDELSFPKNAEIREVADINVDWCRGTYAAKSGLFPSNHVRRL